MRTYHGGFFSRAEKPSEDIISHLFFMNKKGLNAALHSSLLQHQKTVAEVVLRWHLQMGGSMIAKSSHPERIRENFQVYCKQREGVL
jgi:diketogulonate reductase-like aldo/keto reductase